MCRDIEGSETSLLLSLAGVVEDRGTDGEGGKNKRRVRRREKERGRNRANKGAREGERGSERELPRISEGR